MGTSTFPMENTQQETKCTEKKRNHHRLWAREEHGVSAVKSHSAFVQPPRPGGQKRYMNTDAIGLRGLYISSVQPFLSPIPAVEKYDVREFAKIKMTRNRRKWTSCENSDSVRNNKSKKCRAKFLERDLSLDPFWDSRLDPRELRGWFTG